MSCTCFISFEHQRREQMAVPHRHPLLSAARGCGGATLGSNAGGDCFLCCTRHTTARASATQAAIYSSSPHAAITTESTGSPCCVYVLSILSRTSKPSTTSPNTTLRPSAAASIRKAVVHLPLLRSERTQVGQRLRTDEEHG